MRTVANDRSGDGTSLIRDVVAGVPWAAVLTILLLIELLWYKQQDFDVKLQSASCSLIDWIQDWTDYLVVYNKTEFMSMIMGFHVWLSSHAWMLIAACVSFVNYDVGSDLYTYVIFGHTIKNISKSIIASPRVFWFCDSGFAEYCGRGYSLPSGHSMMSLSFWLFVIGRRPRPLVILSAVLFEVFIIYEVMLLGTHTPADIIIGFSYALWWYAFYHAAKAYYYEGGSEKSYSKHNVARRVVRTVVLMCALTVLMYTLELAEEEWDAEAEHPEEWEVNYANNCRGIDVDNADEMMKNSSAFQKSGMYIGLMIGYFGRQLLNIRNAPSADAQEQEEKQKKKEKKSGGDSRVVWAFKMLLRLAIGFAVYRFGAKWFSHQFDLPTRTATKMVKYMAQEVWVLALAPILFHVLGLASLVHGHGGKVKAE